MTPLEEQLYHILNFFPQWVWAWTLLAALWGIFLHAGGSSKS